MDRRGQGREQHREQVHGEVSTGLPVLEAVISRARDGRLEISVSDSGPGIPPDQLEQVFERFHRLDHSRSRDRGGSGLGPAIARAIVEAHRGRIHAESPPGQGAAFVVEPSRLPASTMTNPYLWAPTGGAGKHGGGRGLTQHVNAIARMCWPLLCSRGHPGHRLAVDASIDRADRLDVAVVVNDHAAVLGEHLTSELGSEQQRHL
jgi:Histidine kinase-, DNA gyrase B-, and HSP90-like ATPase